MNLEEIRVKHISEALSVASVAAVKTTILKSSLGVRSLMIDSTRLVRSRCISEETHRFINNLITLMENSRSFISSTNNLMDAKNNPLDIVINPGIQIYRNFNPYTYSTFNSFLLLNGGMLNKTKGLLDSEIRELNQETIISLYGETRETPIGLFMFHVKFSILFHRWFQSYICGETEEKDDLSMIERYNQHIQMLFKEFRASNNDVSMKYMFDDMMIDPYIGVSEIGTIDKTSLLIKLYGAYSQSHLDWIEEEVSKMESSGYLQESSTPSIENEEIISEMEHRLVKSVESKVAANTLIELIKRELVKTEFPEDDLLKANFALDFIHELLTIPYRELVNDKEDLYNLNSLKTDIGMMIGDITDRLE